MTREMDNRLTFAHELLIGLLWLIGVAATKLYLQAANFFILAQTNSPKLVQASTEYDYMRWLLLPLIGAAVAAGICLAFSNQEQKRDAPGRAMSGIFIGTLSVQLLAQMPYMDRWIIHPHALVLIGFVVSLLIYGFSQPFVRKYMDRTSHNLADKAASKVEEKLP